MVKTVIKVTFVVESVIDVGSFNTSAFRGSLATALGVLPSAIALQVAAGSVIVEATITNTKTAAGQKPAEDIIMLRLGQFAKNPAKASEELGVTISAASKPKKTIAPVPSPPPGIVSDASAAAALAAAGTTAGANEGADGGVIAVVVILILAAAAGGTYYVLLQRRKQSLNKLLHAEVSSVRLGIEYVEPSAEDAIASKGDAYGDDDGVRPNVRTSESHEV